ncbi:H(+)-transporting V0 sector ATPase subunit a [Lachancea thermotolerans CBS 6340]|uniref:V-type proton ATPase subunit a n=1 Tax=Lachancea thermotolerans (strain ATCC 56472 / CBS 6340 / NRRL Y-8284) TaxID=559295 RepID=C5DF49_LACTC|nr:KLTH0D12210p [Lachancea thermotolerans CBS 6340]CAR22804.1 KLTH0D12210p [Lachancea thermotolerans CBS 6340]
MSEKYEAMFRSAEMSLVQLYVPQEIARDTVYSLGNRGLVQFRDLNRKVRAFQRTFVPEVRRLDELQRQYRYFYSLLCKYDIKLYEDFEDEEDEEVLAASPVASAHKLAPRTSKIDDHIENGTLIEKRMQQLVEASEQLELQKSDLEQFRHVLKAGDEFFAQSAGLTSQDSGEENFPRSVSFVTGTIPRAKAGTLEQILWRVLRGNLFFRTVPITEPLYDAKAQKKIYKDAFIVFSYGDIILQRVKKVAESLDASLYEISDDQSNRSKQLSEVNSRLADVYTVLDTTNTTLETELFAVSKELHAWNTEIAREKAVYETLNLFDFDSNRKTLVGEGWVPQDELGSLQVQLANLTETLGVDVPSIVQVLETNRTPPTFHRTNKFTAAFQNICDCYGTATYREVNPGLPTIVTFPFMFAVMFGDMGHGMLMSMVAGLLVFNEKALGKMKRDEIFDMAFSGRYILLLMGLFSIYTGFLYNDMFSKSLTLFKSGWEWPSHWHLGEAIEAKSVGTYVFGLDWAWHGTENALLFSNSYKMKLSVLLGFIHMTYSYMFSLVNYVYFQKWIDIIGNFIPGLLFMQGIFGYLTVCIIYKWTIDWVAIGKPAPGLLNTLINMFLSPGTVEEELYPHQAKVQVFLLIMALICIPCLLLIKPLHFKFTQDKHQHIALPDNEAGLVHHETNTGAGAVEDDDDDEEGGHGEEFGDVMIHQVIHTIEFCLNTVSHTASYLRLWALSLAHAQLSTVLWTMTIQIAFSMRGFVGVVMTVILFGMWFVLTCVILVLMEGTSAMLHSLRLHWVESMSKFFEGEGYPYEPFKFMPVEFENEQ